MTCGASRRQEDEMAGSVRLEPGQEQVVSASARERWNHTGVVVSAGEVYEFAALAGSVWKDASHEVSAKGYELSRLAPFRPFRRHKEAPWFELIGGIGESEAETFRVAERNTVTMSATGELVLYANDAGFMYWNNSGSIKVNVRRIS
jgi:hypothetical protein